MGLKALLLAQVATAAVACQAHLPAGARTELCSRTPAQEVRGPRGMTKIPATFWVEFVSLNGDQVCKGGPEEFIREPCPYGEGAVVAKMSWRDARADDFGPGLGPHRYDRPRLLGRASVVPVNTEMGEEVLEEAGYIDHPRVGVARMKVVFTDLQTLDGVKHPICGVLFWHDGKEGIPILAPDYYGQRVAADWGEESFVQLYSP